MITVGHTPDADDAFMFYYLTNVFQNKEIKLVLKDIESLNSLVISNAIDCSAVSFFTYFKCADNYELLDVGACFGENYGPVVVKKANPTITFSQEVVAVPGENTTAYLLLKLFNPQLATLSYPFDKIPNLVLEEKVKYGLLIHEMQQTYKEYGLEKVVDLGEFWFNLTKLPIPLGCIVIRKTLPSSVKQKIKEHIKESILFALSNKNKAFEYSLKFARFSDRNNTLTFIDKYVKEFSLHIDEKHAQAITTLAEFAYKNGLINKEVKITII